jgi:hypothetical protein
MKYLLILVLLCFLNTELIAQEVPEAFTEEVVVEGIDYEDDFNPGLGLFVLMMLTVFIALLGAGAVLAVSLIVLISALVAFGIVTSSAVIALTTKKLSTGLKAFVLMTTGVTAAAAGAGLAVLAKDIWELNIRYSHAAITGSVSGLILGILIALMFNFICGQLSSRLTARFKQSKTLGGE